MAVATDIAATAGQLLSRKEPYLVALAILASARRLFVVIWTLVKQPNAEIKCGRSFEYKPRPAKLTKSSCDESPGLKVPKKQRRTKKPKTHQ